MLCLLVVQLVVAGVSAAGGCCDHSSGLRVCHARCCIIPRTCRNDKIRQALWRLPFQGKNDDALVLTSRAPCFGRECTISWINLVFDGIKTSDVTHSAPAVSLNCDNLKNLTPSRGTNMQQVFSANWSSPKPIKVYISGIMLEGCWWNDWC